MQSEDMFPQSIIERWQDWTRLTTPSTDDIEQAQPFISKLPIEGGIKILFLPVESTDGTKTNHIYTLDRLSTKAKGIRWFGVDLRMRKEIWRPRKNEDVTLAFKSRNTFTTKKFFTFGVRHVAEGTVHVYQTLATPLIFYLPRRNVVAEEGTLDYSEDLNYQQYLMHPYSIVYLRSTYVILTAGKSLFAVDVVRSDVLSPHEMISQDDLELTTRELIQSPSAPDEPVTVRCKRLSKRPPKRSEPKRYRMYEMPSHQPGPSNQLCPSNQPCPSNQISPCDIPGPSNQPCDIPGPSNQPCDIPGPSQEEMELDENLDRFYTGIIDQSLERFYKEMQPDPISDELKEFLGTLPKIIETDPEMESLQPYFPPAEELEPTLIEDINLDDYLDLVLDEK